MNDILLAFDGPQAAEWKSALRSAAGNRAVHAWPDDPDDLSDLDRYAYACVWLPPRGLLPRLRNLKAILNLGAGVDRLLADPSLPDVPIARVAHGDLTMRVTEYVVLHVLMHHRRQRLYDAQQRAKTWAVHDQPAANEVSVGVMGLGVIGRSAAEALARLGFKVAGWSRTPKSIPGIACCHGAEALDAFLARAEILVCLLPQTPETEGLLNLSLLRKLKRDGAAGGAYLVNAARGRIQSNTGILAALDEGALAGATLDVFPQEPLPPDNPLWSHPKVTITPHNAGDVSPHVFAPLVIEQIERFERGVPLDNPIDRSHGY